MFSMINKIHWHSNETKHGEAETVWRYLLHTTYIRFGKDQLKKIKLLSQHCRYITKKTIYVEMGPVSQS